MSNQWIIIELSALSVSTYTRKIPLMPLIICLHFNLICWSQFLTYFWCFDLCPINLKRREWNYIIIREKKNGKKKFSHRSTIIIFISAMFNLLFSVLRRLQIVFILWLHWNKTRDDKLNLIIIVEKCWMRRVDFHMWKVNTCTFFDTNDDDGGLKRMLTFAVETWTVIGR